jgi:hypothetical protein
MAKPLTRSEIVERLHVHPLQNYALISNVAKGIALGAAGLVLLQILSNLEANWMRLLPWAASLAAILLSYLKLSQGILVSNNRTNVRDSLLPLLMSVVELLLFAVLAVDKDSPYAWLNWPAFLAAHSFLAAALLHSRIGLVDLQRDFTHDASEEDVSQLAGEYGSWLKSDRLETSLAAILQFVFWIVQRFWIGPKSSVWLVTGFAFVCFIFAWKPILNASREYKRIDELVSDLPVPSTESHTDKSASA